MNDNDLSAFFSPEGQSLPMPQAGQISDKAKGAMAAYLLKTDGDGQDATHTPIPLSSNQRSFLQNLLDTRDYQNSILLSNITEEELRPLQKSKEIGDWFVEQTIVKAKAGALTKDAAKAIIFDVIFSNMQLSKGAQKALELLGKWEGWSSEKHVHSVEEGAEMIIAFRGAPKKEAKHIEG